MRHCPRCGAELTKQAFMAKKCQECDCPLFIEDNKDLEDVHKKSLEPQLDGSGKSDNVMPDEHDVSDEAMPLEDEGWHRVFHIDFTRPNPDMSGLLFCFDEMDRECEAFSTSPHGLMLKAYGIFWIKDLNMPSDVKVVASIRWPEKIDGLEMLINTIRQKQIFAHFPPGYGCQFAGYAGTVNFLARMETTGIAYADNGIKALFKPLRKYKVALEREADRVSQYIDDEPILSRIEPLPLPKKAGGLIAIKAWTDIEMQSISVYGKSRFGKTNPFEEADRTFIAEDFDGAVRGYLSIAEVHEGRDIAEQALTKAYLVACRLENADDLKRRISRKLETDFPVSPYILTMMEADVLCLWKAGKCREALGKAARIFEFDPRTRIMPEILSLPRRELEPQVATDLINLLSRTQDLVRANISEFGLIDLGSISKSSVDSLACIGNKLASLEPIRGMKISNLFAGNNEITSLAPLSGMKLTRLDVASNQITSLEGIGNTPIKILNCSNNPLTSLESLRGMKIETLLCAGTQIQDLAGLEGMPLKSLNLNNCRISSLAGLSALQLKELRCEHNRIESLEGMPCSLRRLYCGHNKITSLEPLRGMNFRLLHCEGNSIKDIEPLKEMNLHEFNCSRTGIETLAALEGTPLRALICSNNRLTSIDPVRPCPLKYLDCRDNPLTSLGLFEDDIPETFLFTPSILSAPYFEKLVAKWSARPELENWIKKLKIERAFDLGDVASLRELAVTFNGHKYVYVERSLTWDKANAKARQLGGYLVSITSAEENDLAYSLIFPSGMRSGTWLGIEAGPDGKGRWVTGESITYKNLLNKFDIDPRRYYAMVCRSAGAWTSVADPTAGSAFIIEWSD